MARQDATRRRVLITGMSGVGKSSVLSTLADPGFRVVDTDYGGLSRTDQTGEWVWDLDRVRSALDDAAELIFVSGTASNMSPLLPRFGLVVLLSAPAEVMLERLATRTNNPYGSSEAERAESLHYKETVEPLLRTIADVEIDTTPPLDHVVDAILARLRTAAF